MYIAITVYDRVKMKEIEKIENYLDFAREQKRKKTMGPEDYGGTNCSWCAWNGPHS